MFGYLRSKVGQKTRKPPTTLFRLRLEVLEDRTVPSVIFPANNGFELPSLSSNTRGNYKYPLSGGTVTLADQGGSGWAFSGLTGVADNGSDPRGNSFNVMNATNGNDDGTTSNFGQAALIQSGNSLSSFGPSIISQAITFPGSGNASVTFSIELRGDLSIGDNPIDVKFDDLDLGTYLALSGSSFNTVTTPSVFLTAGTHTLSFTGTNTVGSDNTQFIDNVSISSNPSPDIAMLSAQLQSGHILQYTYETTGNPGAFQVGLYRSADGKAYDPFDLIDSQTVTPSPTNSQTPGSFTLPASFTSDPSKPFLLVAADPDNVIAESDEGNNVASCQLPDIAPTQLQWNTTQAGVDFSYQVTGTDLPQDTTAALYWADAGKNILSVSTNPIPIAAPRGTDQPIHVSVADLTSPPAAATQLLLVLDPRDAAHAHGLVEESDEGNNVDGLALLVTGLKTTPPEPTQLPYDEAALQPDLQVAIQKFRDLVAAYGGSFAPMGPGDGLRSTEYQAHLYELRTKFIELTTVPGISAFILDQGQKGRPQLSIVSGSFGVLYSNLVDQVNAEIRQHLLVPQADGAPAVNPPGASSHELGLAVDITVRDLPASVSLDALAAEAGLRRPYANDVVHYELASFSPKLQAEIIGNSPINILVVDSQGRRIGFDPVTGQAVNQFGPFGEYSGPGSEPQFIHLPLGAVVPGPYFITGVGTGTGPYHIIVRIAGDDSSDPIVDRVIAAGIASPGQPLPPVEPIDLFLKAINVAPTLSPVASLAVDEGTAVGLAAEATDANSQDSLSFTLDAAPAGASIDPVTGLFTWTATDGPSTSQVTVRVTDNGSPTLSDTKTFTITVNNVPPTASITGPTDGVRSQPRTFTLSAADPSPVDQAAGFTFDVDWGDGSTQTVAGPSGLQLDHVYADTGSYTVKVTATDKDGGVSNVASRLITISAAELQSDTLAVGGTAGDDQIEVHAERRGAQIDVEMESKLPATKGVDREGDHLHFEGTFPAAGLTRLLVYGGRGDDHIEIDNNVLLPAIIFAGDGNDHIEAGGSPTVIVGGSGDDHLEGGSGSDILIGGTGNDHIEGKGNSDILIGGTTDFDNNLPALIALMSEWGRTDESYLQRVANLSNSTVNGVSPSGMGLNGGNFLAPVTVHDDGAGNHLEGGPGLDWYFANLDGSGNNGVKDKVSGLKGGEVVTGIVF